MVSVYVLTIWQQNNIFNSFTGKVYSWRTNEINCRPKYALTQKYKRILPITPLKLKLDCKHMKFWNNQVQGFKKL